MNTKVHGGQFGYASLRDRKVTAAVPRVFSYPSEANNIAIEQWGAHYIVFENLPNTLDISVFGNGFGNLYATTLYLPSNGKAVVTPVPFDRKNGGHIQRKGLLRNSKIVLMVTADAPQTLRYVATARPAVNNIEAIIAVPRQQVSDILPDVITDALGNLTQPSLPPGWYSGLETTRTQLEPMTQIHLASDYADVAIGGPQASYLYTASDWGLEIFTLIDPTQPVRIGEIATPRPGEIHRR